VFVQISTEYKVFFLGNQYYNYNNKQKINLEFSMKALKKQEARRKQIERDFEFQQQLEQRFFTFFFFSSFSQLVYFSTFSL
jgi:hypothetical protein